MKRSVSVVIGLILLAGLVWGVMAGRETAVEQTFFYTRTGNGVVKVSSTGSKETIINQVTGNGLEILGNEIYLNDQTYGADILVYDLEGNYLRTISTPTQASQYLDFVILSDRRIALMDNRNDKIYFVNSSGNLLATTNISDNPGNSLQNLDGIIVNNQLVFSEDGQKRILKIDLTTYQKSIFKDFSALPGPWLGAITYADGQYYLATSSTIYRFSETSAITEIATIPAENITGLVVKDGFAYASMNFAGKIYRVDLNSGSSSILASYLDFPQDLEIFTVPPTIQTNYTNGAPGSFFTVVGTDFPANSIATIQVNSAEMGTVSTDADGGFSFILTTANADEGAYFVTASVNPTATTQFVLDAADPVRLQEDTGDTFDVPTGIAFNQFVYLPSIIR